MTPRRVKKLKRPFETMIDDRMTVSLADISNEARGSLK